MKLDHSHQNYSMSTCHTLCSHPDSYKERKACVYEWHQHLTHRQCDHDDTRDARRDCTRARLKGGPARGTGGRDAAFRMSEMMHKKVTDPSGGARS
ncbi:hypothetical protein [Dietzia maris]|uniref:hypothetical protein n=1 Tax=Dietzia maris TaxID=37915 RepID=UPI0037C77117